MKAAHLGLVAAAVLLMLGLAELGMHILGLGQVMTYDRDPRFGYRMRPLQKVSTYGDPIEINALGLRGPPVLEPKYPGVARVLFLGGSVSYGGVSLYEGDLFCRVLENLARNDGSRVEAVNVSAPGWGPQNWTAWVEANGLLDADAVVIVIAAADRARPFGTLEAYALAEDQPGLLLGHLWRNLATARAARSEPIDAALALNRSALDRLKTAVGSRPLLVAFVPSAGPDPRPELWEPYERLFPQALDLRGRLGAADHLDADQLSGSGQRIVADAIYTRLRPTLAELSEGGTRSGP